MCQSNFGLQNIPALFVYLTSLSIVCPSGSEHGDENKQASKPLHATEPQKNTALVSCCKQHMILRRAESAVKLLERVAWHLKI